MGTTFRDLVEWVRAWRLGGFREGDIGVLVVVIVVVALEVVEGDMDLMLRPTLRLLTSSNASLLSLWFASRTLRSTPDNLSRSRAISSAWGIRASAGSRCRLKT